MAGGGHSTHLPIVTQLSVDLVLASGRSTCSLFTNTVVTGASVT